MTGKLLRIPDVAQILDVTTDRAYQLARDGVLPVVRMGPRQLRVDAKQLQEWIAAGGQSTPGNWSREMAKVN